jgi:hypothetical protein
LALVAIEDFEEVMTAPSEGETTDKECQET